MSESENKTAQAPPPESLPWWDGETELTPENVQSFRYDDLQYAENYRTIQQLSRDPTEVAFRLDYDTFTLVETSAKAPSGKILMEIRALFAAALPWKGVDALDFIFVPNPHYNGGTTSSSNNNNNNSDSNNNSSNNNNSDNNNNNNNNNNESNNKNTACTTTNNNSSNNQQRQHHHHDQQQQQQLSKKRSGKNVRPYLVLLSDGGLDPNVQSFQECMNGKLWVPKIVFEAEWLSTEHRNVAMCDAAAQERLDKLLTVDPDRFNGKEGRAKVQQYFQVDSSRFVIFVAPDLQCVFVFVKPPTPSFAAGERDAFEQNQRLAQADDQVRWHAKQRVYVADHDSLPNPMFVWDLTLQNRKFVLNVYDEVDDRVIAMKFNSEQTRANVDVCSDLWLRVQCAICGANLHPHLQSVHGLEHVGTLDQIDKAVQDGVHWWLARPAANLLRWLQRKVERMKGADATTAAKKQLLDKLRQSYEQYQKDAMGTSDDGDDGDEDGEDHDDGDGKNTGVGNKRKLNKVDGKKAKQRRLVRERKRRIEAQRGRIEDKRGRIEAKRGRIEAKRGLIEAKKRLLTLMPGNHPQRPQTQQDIPKLREELKELKQQLASEQADLQQLERELRQAQSDSPNNTSSKD